MKKLICIALAAALAVCLAACGGESEKYEAGAALSGFHQTGIPHYPGQSGVLQCPSEGR